jgi:hypothetical protein
LRRAYDDDRRFGHDFLVMFIMLVIFSVTVAVGNKTATGGE